MNQKLKDASGLDGSGNELSDYHIERAQKIMDEILANQDKPDMKQKLMNMSDRYNEIFDKMREQLKINESDVNNEQKGSSGGALDEFAKTNQQEMDTASGDTSKQRDLLEMSTLFADSNFKEYMKKKKERPNVGEIYKKKLAKLLEEEKFKKKERIRPEVKIKPSQRGEGDWRTKMEKLMGKAMEMDGHSDTSGSSTELSSPDESEESELDSDDQKLVEKAMKRIEELKELRSENDSSTGEDSSDEDVKNESNSRQAKEADKEAPKTVTANKNKTTVTSNPKPKPNINTVRQPVNANIPAKSITKKPLQKPVLKS